MLPRWRLNAAQPLAQADPLRQPSLGRFRRLWHLAFRGQAPSASAGSLARTLGLMLKHLFASTVVMSLCVMSQATEAWRLSSRGYGPVHAGMTQEKAESLLGVKLLTYENRPLEPSCDHVYPAKGHKGVTLMVQDGRITRIAVSSPAILTKSGARVGDSTSRLKALFGQQLEIEPHTYDDKDFYYYVWEKDRQHGVKFEIVRDRVVEIYAGDRSIELAEGCS